MPLRDTRALEEWAERENPPYSTWQRIAAWTRLLVGQHHLGPVDARVGRVLYAAVARLPVAFNLALHYFNKVVGHLAAAVEALVDNGALFVSLRKVVAVEVGKSTAAGVRQIDVGKLAV